jgi:osmoprotectant transport system substrate-binding protein
LENRQVDLIAAANTDGLIAARDLLVLEDDAHYFPPYDAVPIVRPGSLQGSPQVARALERLTGRITAQDMRRLNFAVDGEKKDPAAVVREFLGEKKFLV